MWRWLHSLPRAIRHQFHHTGASAGVCVDDNDNRLKRESPERKEKYDGKVHCKAGRHRYHGRKRRFGQRCFWRMVQGPCSSPDTLKCGPVVTVGLHSGHAKACSETNDSSEGKKHCLFSRVAASLLTWNDITKSFGKNILTESRDSVETDKEPQDNKTNKQNNHPEVETLEAAFSNFERVCEKYTAVGKGIMASQAAQAGHMNSAVKLWQESSKLGHGKSQFNLAVCYETGQGVKKDLSKAVQYYLKAAEDEHAMAMYNLALLYMEGLDSVPGDKDRALTLLSRAADLGLTEAQKYLGMHYMEDDKDTAKSVFYLTKAADQNDAEAQYLLGICYECGYGIQENTCKAAHWYSQAAKGGNMDAMYSLAVFHQNGYGGLPESHKSAKTLFQRAAELGHEDSKNELEKLLAEENSKPSKISSSQDSPRDGLLLKINSCVSAPCLTDLVREDISPPGKPMQYDPISQLGTLSHIFSQLMVPRALIDLPTLMEIQQKRGSVSEDDSGSDSGVSFKLGVHEDDDIDETTAGNPYTMAVSTQSCAHHGLHRKTSTMPDLQATVCK